MQRFKTIGLVLHLEKDNRDAINYALDCAKQNEAELHIICAQRNKLPQAEQEHIEQTLSAQLTHPHQVQFLTGHPVVEIARFASQNEIELLILEPDTQSGLRRFFFGSLTLSLLRKAPCPVWVVKPSHESNYRRVLICVDPVAEEEVKRSLNNKLIEIGTSFAKRESAECHLLCCWHLEGESTLDSPFVRTPTEELEQLKNDEKARVARSFEALQAHNKKHLDNCQTHLVNGEPVVAISRFVDKNDIDLVVMGTVARTGVKGFVIGNTAEAIINQLECSIMAIKPDGFVSPLI